MKTGKIRKYLAVLGFIMVSIWLGLSIFLMEILSDFSRQYYDGAYDRLVFLILSSGGYLSGILCLTIGKKKPNRRDLALIGSILFLVASVFALVIGISSKKIIPHENWWNNGLVNSFAICQRALSILILLLWIAHFVITLLSEPRTKAIVARSDSRPVENNLHPLEEETPTITGEERLATRLDEAKAMLDEGLIGQEDFKKIKEHILDSEI